MAIIQCPNCGNSISDRAQQCPKCGTYLHNGSSNQLQNGQNGIDTTGLEWYMWVLFLCVGFLIPLIYYFVKKDKAPVRAKNALVCVWIDLAYWLILMSI